MGSRVPPRTEADHRRDERVQQAVDSALQRAGVSAQVSFTDVDVPCASEVPSAAVLPPLKSKKRK